MVLVINQYWITEKPVNDAVDELLPYDVLMQTGNVVSHDQIVFDI